MVITALQEKLGNKVLTGNDLLSRYSHIWRMDIPLTAKAVILPHSTQDVADAMKICNEYAQPVVVHGGLTNLVGSTETSVDDVVISMEKMNAIEEVDVSSRSITVQAGTILENIHNEVEKYDLLFPLNFGAKGSAQIGGIISTNAGGLRVLKYGMTRALVLGLEAVLADGTIISSMKKIIKDNSAYDLKQYFIGSEGTLGIVTKAVLKLIEKPKSRVSAFIAFDDYINVVSFLKYIDKGLAGGLSGYELIWGSTYKIMTSPPALSSPPLPHGHKYYVLTELLGSDHDRDLATMEKLLVEATEKELISDAVLAQSRSDLDWFWKIREDVHVVSSKCNNDQHFDISLPIGSIGTVVDDILAQLLTIPGVEEAYPFGHVADGNIHFIVGKKDTSPELRDAINECIYSPLKKLGGSVSAEHGIGLDKKRYLSLCRSQEEIDLMQRIKTSMDPKSILNRGKVLDI